MDFTHIVVLVRYESRERIVNSYRRNKQTLNKMCSVDEGVHEYCCAMFLNHLGTRERASCGSCTANKICMQD
jgi:hypothetical protein